ncbi:MAG: SLOG family protein [Methanobacteriota archaeon]
MIRLIIAGPRSCTKNTSVSQEIAKYIAEIDGVDEIVTGGSTGVDLMAKQYALLHQITYKEFIPNWQNDLNAAGILRDARMAEYASHLLVFFNSDSRESMHLLMQAEKNHLIIKKINAPDGRISHGEQIRGNSISLIF